MNETRPVILSRSEESGDGEGSLWALAVNRHQPVIPSEARNLGRGWLAPHPTPVAD